ncbi:octopamine receptor Oamb-like [Limulus polyphemus]|uniref:Octopamine receptor Oamb-like n=1 Tax=Limulus polyphemus TaxID=6850 RepID=A0ABM1BHT0_LIMPO|nr:octopamine receptor Oamb-like [Limulus polyphemus]XP_013782268.1 octopamine receptor Oamb-like [Limulus polyphemus]XP_022250257.1 octopamine receptor Oamb-like [Limulus polyphemus]
MEERDPFDINGSRSDIWWGSNQTNLTEFDYIANSTDFPSSEKKQLLVYDIIIPVIGVIIVIANSAVVISSGLILKKGVSSKATYLFLGNLAMSDVLTGVTILVGQFYPDSIRTQLSCLIQLGTIVSATLASSWSITLIGIDRFIFIVYGLYYNIWMTTRRARIMIGGVWFLCFLIGFSPAMGWSYPGDGSRCWYVSVVKPSNLVFTVVVGIFLPLGFITVLYSFILYKAIHQVDIRKEGTEEKPKENIQMSESRGQQTSRAVTSEDGNRGQNSATGDLNVVKKTKKKWKAIKVVLFTLGAFVISWFPYFIASLIYVFRPSLKLAVAIASILAMLGFLNSFLNPVIYAWWHRGLRKFIMEDCLFCKKKKKKAVYRPGGPRSKTSLSSTSTTKISTNSSTLSEPRSPGASQA